MLIIGIIGIILLAWWGLQFFYGHVLPWLFIVSVFLTCLGFILDHPFISILLAVIAFLCWGAYLNYKETHKTEEQKANESLMKKLDEISKDQDKLWEELHEK